ncbi:MAG: cysteine rich repeat-containing protein [Nitrospira sp.]|nr:cysteine rich repeat-containing protein [Nitrospira sp.]
MGMDREIRGTARLLVLAGGLMVGLWLGAGLAWSADSSTPPAQDAPAASAPPSSGAGGAGPEERGRGGHGAKKACAEDVKRLCAGVKPGEGRIVQCLKEHAQDLSSTCAQTMQQRGPRRP